MIFVAIYWSVTGVEAVVPVVAPCSREKLQALADRKYWLGGGMIRGRTEREGEVEKGIFEGGSPLMLVN